MMWGAAGGPMRIAAWNQVHPDATLHWLATQAGVITGGDDGRVVLTRFADPIIELYRAPGCWIDALAFDPGAGLVAAATGRSVRVIEPGRLEVVRFDGHPSTVAALAFTPSGDAVAAAHYGGVTLHVFRQGVRQFCRKGSMVAVTVSPDARFVVAGAQDREVVVWPVAGGEPMEMTGYGGKPTALSWSGDGGHLATSGADGVIVWPFGGRRGPFGRRPLELAPERKALVTAVAFHPRDRRIAFGYRDGYAAVIGFSGAPETVAEADGEAVTALAWAPDGYKLAVCGDGGRVAVRTWAKPKPGPLNGLFKRLWG
jgi:WD40 repeat protein